MSGTAVVTGPTSGIGRWIALGLAQAGYGLVLVARDPVRAEATRDWIAAQVPGAVVGLVGADLSSVASTEAAARSIAGAHPALALLVNNAGMFQARREVTAEGREAVLATNHLAPFILMRELRPALEAGAPSRIVTVGSSTSDRARIDPERLEMGRRWRMQAAYAQSKLAVMMATFEAARRLEGTGVVANVVHPGLVATQLIRTPGVIGLVWRIMARWALSEQEGAATPLHVALAPELAGVTGRYFKDRSEAAPNPLALDPARCRAVWDATERLLCATGLSATGLSATGLSATRPPAAKRPG